MEKVNDLGSSLATMTAGELADFLGSLGGKDVVCAYAQAPSMETQTWPRLPRAEWPEVWGGLKDPIAPLVSAWHSHPDAGSCLYAWGDEKMNGFGFRMIDG